MALGDGLAGPAVVDPRVQEVARLFDAAEATIKVVEIHIGKLVIPAVNELRYAGHHLLVGLSASSEEAREVNLGKAAGHCTRSMYDAAEAGLIYCLKAYAEFESNYRGVVITSVIHDYPAVRGQFREVRQFVADAVKDRETRQQHAEQCVKLFRELHPCVARLTDARDELNKLVNAGVRSARRWRIGAVIALAGALLAGWQIYLTQSAPASIPSDPAAQTERP